MRSDLLVLNQTSFATVKEIRQISEWVLEEIQTPEPCSAAEWLGFQLGRIVIDIRESPHTTHYGYFRSALTKKHLRATLIGYVPEQPAGLYQREMKNGPPAIRPLSWEESLVCILAHEGKHLVQFIEGPANPAGHYRQTKYGLVYVKPRIFNELQAEWSEYETLQRWRERSFL